MINELSALFHLYLQHDLNEEFYEFCYLLSMLVIGGRLTKIVQGNGSKIPMTLEILFSAIGLIMMVRYMISYTSFSFMHIQLVIGLLIIWLNECVLYLLLIEVGVQQVINVFFTTNIILVIGEIILTNNANYSIIFDFTSTNILVICTQLSFAGQRSLKSNEKSLFTIISRQDSFRLMVYFLLFHIMNNCIKAYSNPILLIPTFGIVPFYIYSITRFNQRQYKKASAIFLLTLVSYQLSDYYFK